MKRVGFTLFVAAFLALSLGAQEAVVRADVPFDFVVGSATLAAGQYTIRTGPVGVQFAGNETYFLLSNPPDSQMRSDQPKLVFHRYGDQYFLSSISTGSDGRDLPVSRRERELTKAAGSAGLRRTEILLAKR
jgi:hypothetical protein